MMKNRLDEIIDRHSEGPVAKLVVPASRLRPLSQEDRWEFAGCNSKTPEIARKLWGSVLLDGTEVVAFIYDQGDDPSVYSFDFTYHQPGVARAIAERVAAIDDATAADLLQFLQKA